MAFAEDFAACIGQYGVVIAPESVPEQDLLSAALEYLQSWLNDLDPAVREGFDEASASEPISVLLAGADINAAPAIPALLEAFDQAQGLTLSYLMEAAVWCASNPVPAEA